MKAAPAGWVWEDPLRSESKGQSKICVQQTVPGKFRAGEEKEDACYQKEEVALAKVGEDRKSGRA